MDFLVTVHLRKEILVNLSDLLSAWIISINEELLGARVSIVEEQHAAGVLTIPASPSRFLVIGFDTSWHLEVRDKAHVRSINPHAKGVCSNGHIGLLADKLPLDLAAHIVAHPPMVSDAFSAPATDHLADFFDPFTSGTVDDACVMLLDQML